MITHTAVSRHEVISPTTATERYVFSRVSVGPDGAVLILRLGDFTHPNGAAHTIVSSAQAAVLEELGRMLRIRLREQEQAGLTHPYVDVAGAEPCFAPVTKEAQGCAPTTGMPRS